jgi:flagellar hook assembly protein FlgD
MDKRLFIIIVVFVFVGLILPAGSVRACGGGPGYPVADIIANPAIVTLGNSVELDGSASYDLYYGTIIKYEWDFTNDDSYDYYETSSDHNDGDFNGITTHTYNSIGTYTVKLRVTDNDNYTDTDTCTVTVVPIKVPTDYSTIQAAITACPTGVIVEVAQGRYYENINFDSKKITLTSSDPNDPYVVAATIIDGNDVNSVVTFTSGDANSTITGFTITNGNAKGGSANDNGGGIYCHETSPTITKCVITNNKTKAGGYGGGIYFKDCSTAPTVKDCVFEDNQAGCYGGGIYNKNSDLNIFNSIFWGNKANASGGDYGGGIFNENSSPKVINCTFYGNEALHGCGIENYNGSSIPQPEITNCIFWGKPSSSWEQIDNFGSGDVNVTYCDVEDGNYTTNGNFDSDPNFLDPDNPAGADGLFFTWDDALQLSSTSICVDAANGNVALEKDIIGRERIDVNYVSNEGTGSPDYVDIGAYEAITIWFVDSDAIGGIGDSWPNAFNDLQDALNAAAAGDEIWVAEGTYKPTNGSTRTVSFEPVAGVSIYGGFEGTETIRWQRDFTGNKTVLSGDIGAFCDVNDNSYHVVVGADDAVLDGLTITNGNADGSGTNSYGAGIYCLDTSVTIRNCIISDNNCSDYGGAGIYNTAALTLENCFIVNNHSLARGGGMHNRAASTISNCVFVGNTAAIDGGGIFNPVSPTITNCTFTGNHADKGGAITNFAPARPKITNCILYGNTADSYGYDDVYNTSGTSPTFSYCNVKGGISGTGNIDADPRFASTLNIAGKDGLYGTYDDGLCLATDSPCVDAGNNSATDLTKDIIGNPRKADGDHNDVVVIDIGAYEVMTAWYVDCDASSGGDGKSWDSAFNDLQDALDEPNLAFGDEIWVAEGTYEPTTDTNQAASFQLISGVSLYGGFDGTETAHAHRNWIINQSILSGDIGTLNDYSDNSYHVVKGADDAVLNGLVITCGNANGIGTNQTYGGGMYNYDCSPIITNCTFSGNKADGYDGYEDGYGGAIYNEKSSPVITSCTFSYNSAGSEYGETSIAGYGGGIYDVNSNPTITNCVFSENHASVDGGGMCNYGSSPVVTSCTFYGNYTSGDGGGIYDVNSNPTITNCVFSENHASIDGGGMCNYDSSPVVTNCTFYGNYTSGDGGGIYNNGASSTALLTNCIFWDNSATGTGDEVYNVSSADPNFCYSDVAGCGGSGSWDPNFGTDGGGNIDSDPNFVDSNDPEGPDNIFGTYDDGLVLQMDSPCVDSADGDAAPSADITGRVRVDVNSVTNTGIGDPNYTDRGAYESPEIWFVDIDAGSGGDGISWSNAYDDLQDALAAATTGDEIWVAEGTYKPTNGSTRTVSFELVAGVSLYGGFVGTETGRLMRDRTKYPTILSGDIGTVGVVTDNSYHVITGADNAILDGFTITAGNATGSSGYDGSGGGIFCDATAPTIRNCVIKENNAEVCGGGIFNTSTGIFEKCFIVDNDSGNSGGGIYSYGNSVIKNCVIAGNISDYGGGGGLACGGPPPTITNCSFTGNDAYIGGGLFLIISSGNSKLINCIIYGNTADMLPEVFQGGGGNLTFSYCDVNGCGGSGGGWNEDYGIDGGGNIDADPYFANPDSPEGSDGIFGTIDDGLQVLNLKSPCIDAADGNKAPLSDILANARVDINDVNNTGTGDPNYTDIGAYERRGDAICNFSSGKGYTTIQSAINDATNGDVIMVAKGTYYETVDFNSTSVHLTSGDPNDPNTVAATIIDANDNSPGISVITFNSTAAANFILDGMTITGGYHGINCSTLTITSSPTIGNCRVIDNAYWGIKTSKMFPKITNCTISGNGNKGLYCDYDYDMGTPIVSGCRIIDNGSTGIYFSSRQGILKNCIITKNLNDGVELVKNYPTSIINCTIANNTGKGINSQYSTAGHEVENCILWDNNNDLYNVSATYSCIEDDDSGLGNFKINPRFVDVDANNFHLENWSRCIDWGDPDSDYSNEPDGGGGRINIGRYGNTDEATTLIDEDSDGLPEGWLENYWPGYDPNDPNYGPGGNPDIDDFNNVVEYLFGYEPNISTSESMELIAALSSQFNPTIPESLTVTYLLNMQADNTTISFTDTDTSETVRTISKSAAAGLHEEDWDGKDTSQLIVEDGFYDVAISANDGDGNSASYDATTEVYYVHDITNLVCNPYRILPMNNEISKITYDLTVDADVAVNIYDSDEILFRTFSVLQGEPNEVTWDGRDKDASDPNSKYISKEGLYQIEVKYQGMREKEETTVNVFE